MATETGGEDKTIGRNGLRFQYGDWEDAGAAPAVGERQRRRGHVAGRPHARRGEGGLHACDERLGPRAQRPAAGAGHVREPAHELDHLVEREEARGRWLLRRALDPCVGAWELIRTALGFTLTFTVHGATADLSDPKPGGGLGHHYPPQDAPPRPAELNELLPRPTAINPSDSAQLGLLVVRQLATRHGLPATLQPPPYGGSPRTAPLPDPPGGDEDAARADFAVAKASLDGGKYDLASQQFAAFVQKFERVRQRLSYDIFVERRHEIVVGLANRYEFVLGVGVAFYQNEGRAPAPAPERVDSLLVFRTDDQTQFAYAALGTHVTSSPEADGASPAGHRPEPGRVRAAQRVQQCTAGHPVGAEPVQDRLGEPAAGGELGVDVQRVPVPGQPVDQRLLGPGLVGHLVIRRPVGAGPGRVAAALAAGAGPKRPFCCSTKAVTSAYWAALKLPGASAGIWAWMKSYNLAGLG